ncbi:MAG: multicopper oxidase domain-containing protein [Bacteroidia bacterium]|nr:multicopper oxidase domain-containing protein [Bacteroidia bacterium]MCF8427864.1 multicopper oxidase domain-containing protein [Bacteroidia bacterium]MCF8446613.1 multicopper oxidase domain-containing protein [Bacteroidia bacterium]
MRKISLLFGLILTSTIGLKAQYNNLFIPDTLSGTEFNLNIKDTFAQVVASGNQTITGGINGKFWGPTLFFNKGEVVHMNVKNNLNDSTTLHWHGMHLPAVMDGGPHQIIPPGTLWQPFWKVENLAATYWYHPHLHEMTMEQITKGIGGLIIVRDSVESALPLPRTYGIDDIPLVLTDRDFGTDNQLVEVPYGDSMLTNFTLRAQYNVPAQVVRFRVLNGAIERSYNLGFSDSRNFYVIASDGGLLTAPVALNRYVIHAGERIEILVDCSADSGKSIDLKAYNSTLAQNVAGGDVFPNGPFVNYLARKDFNILHLNIGAATSNAITQIPTSLVSITPHLAANANLTRYLTINDTNIAGITGAAFLINHKLFDINYNNYDVPLNNTEIWEIKSTSNFGHPFHIHDVEFNILSVNGAAPAAAQAGWKDVVFVPAQTTVKFIAKFDDFADALHPFMYHCHISLHEDEGMMGQFIVTETSTGLSKTTAESHDFSLYPNPGKDKLFIAFNESNPSVYYISILNITGKAVRMLPQPEWQNGIDISTLSSGVYFLQLTDGKTKIVTTKKFIKD